MIYTDNLEETILFSPAKEKGQQCNSLLIITGFTDCDRILTHLIKLKDGVEEGEYVKVKSVSIILGMTKGCNLTQKKHKKICETINRLQDVRGIANITCRYICNGKEVHSKVYIWRKGSASTLAFCGSANYSMNAFQKRRECMTDCDAKMAYKYYKQLLSDTIDCFDEISVNSKISFSTAEPTAETVDTNNIENLSFEQFESIPPIDTASISLLTANGKVGYGSGINWGIRPNGTKRNPDQAYIPYNRTDRKEGFFPGRVNPTDKNCKLFKVVTKEFGAFYMRLAQANNKGIHSAESNAILGKWIRSKLNVPSGTFITLQMLEDYGATHVRFKKYSDEIYTMEFEPEHET